MISLLDTDRVSLIHGESLATLRALPDKMFDVILTDPPYSPHVHAKLGKERRNDVSAPRPELTFPPMTPDLIAAFAVEYVRLCKSWILSFSDFYHTAVWGHAIRDAGGEWVRTGQWVKTNPMPQMTGDRPACGAEDILIAHASPHSRDWEWAGKGHAAIWRGPREFKPQHPNQKPTWLVQALLGQFAPPGGLVLDAFFGTGTTAVAALRPLRAVGEVDVATACKACSKKITDEYAPPLPDGVRVVGIEGDAACANLAKERILAAM